MRRRILFGALVAASLCLGAMGLSGAASAAPPNPAEWRQLDPDNTIYIDVKDGRIVVELYPEIAPDHVARIKTLARERFYDGLMFHRVVDNFMAQGGDPLGDGSGASTKPDLKAEFLFRRGPEMPFVEAKMSGGAREGFYKTLPIATQPDAQMELTRDRKAAAWGLHCPGIASMARADDPDSANSQFFLMRAPYPSLDKRYTIWGRVVWGQNLVKNIAVGAPPPNPDKMLTVRVASDMPEGERAPIYLLRTDSPEFRQLIDRTRKDRGADFSVCDVQIPVRVAAPRNEKERPWWRIIPLIP